MLPLRVAPPPGGPAQPSLFLLLEQRQQWLRSNATRSSPSRTAPRLDWEGFAGPFSASSERHVPRKAFLRFLERARDAVGNEAEPQAAAAGAHLIYCTLAVAQPAATPATVTPPSAAALQRVKRQLLGAGVSVEDAQLRELFTDVGALSQWRLEHRVQPELSLPPAAAPPSATEVIERDSGDDSLPPPSLTYCPMHSIAAILEEGVRESGERAAFLDAMLANSLGDGGGDGGGRGDGRGSSGAGRRGAQAVDAAWLFEQCTRFVASSSLDTWTEEGLGTALLELLHRERGAADEAASAMRVQAGLFELLGAGGMDLMQALVERRRELVALQLPEFRRVAAVLSSRRGDGGGSRGGDAGGSRLVSGSTFGTPGRPAAFGPGVSVHMQSDLVAQKALQKAMNKASKQGQALNTLAAQMEAAGGGGDDGTGMDAAHALRLQAEELRGPGPGDRRGGPDGGSAGLISVEEAIASVGAGYGGSPKTLLPEGTIFTQVVKKEAEGGGYKYQEVSVPPPKPTAPAPGTRGATLVSVSEMDPLAQSAFEGIATLNRLQSELFDAAYSSNENLLVCAPTGAGKTNVAMLAVCRELSQHLDPSPPAPSGKRAAAAAPGSFTGRVLLDEFKIVYVAPMKALAAEVVAKFSQRLAALRIAVREFTGDMQLTKKEIEETQVIVTTPEKWDVITRKAGDGTLVALVRLLIIDEVHLLAEERGAVIESIVARTLRLVETSQSVIRIVGLSATLPNYRDVATFLRVNPSRGLFYFDGSYRPVPLSQTFVGVTESNPLRRLNIQNGIAFDKAMAAIKRGKQVMVFVHSRKDTAKTARVLKEMAGKAGTGALLSPFSGEEAEDEDGRVGAPSFAAATPTATPTIQGEGRVSLTAKQWAAMQADVARSRNHDVQELFPAGLGIHHAGMLRPDRSLTERMFAAGAIKILVCTATLAWGVNLPAHTVIIKGTAVYDAEAGGYKDLGLLDVMQIFGRAGRPQFDVSGEGIIITEADRLAHYLTLLTNTVPIESSFIRALPDHLNAEIVSGTVTNVREAVVWLSYTYLYVRMLRNPLAYGVDSREKEDDPLLAGKRLALVRTAAARLDECHMARLDARTGSLGVTELGRVASHYYIHNDSIATFNRLTDGDPPLGYGEVLDLIAQADEFRNIKVRDEELAELDALRTGAKVPVKGDPSHTPGKVNLLLQSFISRRALRGFTLISDTAYITQSAGRISRALFEIFLRRGCAPLAEKLLCVAKAVDKQQWWDASPLWQLAPWAVPSDIVAKLEDCGTPLDELCDMSPGDLGALVRHPNMGPRIASALATLPYLEVAATVQPITRSVLRISLTLTAAFTWNDRAHGGGEPWWVWIEGADSARIFHSEYVVVTRKHAATGQPILLEVTIPVFEPMPPHYWVRTVSDRWLGLQSFTEIPFRHLILPERQPPHTDLLPLSPLPLSALRHPAYEALYAPAFSHFNPVQTQAFHALYHTDVPVLLGAPTGSGKTVAAELALFRLWAAHPGAKAVYVAPLKALVAERIRDWRRKFGAGPAIRRSIVELTGDVSPDSATLAGADVIVTTPEKWDAVSRKWRSRAFVRSVGLVILDEVHLLGEERGPVLEVIVSRMRFMAAAGAGGAGGSASIRFVGLSTALANAVDLGDWLGIGPAGVGMFNFRPSVRPIPMEVHIQGFPGKHFCPRMSSMNKPVFAGITAYSPDKPALVFVASRRQTRLTALELLAFCATDDNPKRFLHIGDEEVEAVVASAEDPALKHTLAFGVGIHHAGLCEGDRNLVEGLYARGAIQVLVCTATLAWGVNFPAHLVVIKGTEFYDARKGRYIDFPVTDVLQMMGRAGRPQFDTSGVALILVHEPKKNFYKKFLYEPFPVESQLLAEGGGGGLADHLLAEIVGGTIASRHDAVEYLTWTYMFRRLLQNPAYYGLEDSSNAGLRAFLYDTVDDALEDLAASGVATLGGSGGGGGGGGGGSDSAPAEGPAAAAAASARRSTSESVAGARGAPAVRADAGILATALEDTVAPTALGAISSKFYLKHATVALFARDLVRPASPAAGAGVTAGEEDPTIHAARVLCCAPEFEELPVRHNEDELNAGLARTVPWGAVLRPGGPAVDYNSPHVKAFLLLQARLAHAPLPMADYVTDTKSFIDNALRVINAMIEVAAEAGALGAVLGCMRLVQCVVQARLPGDHPLQQLPGLSSAAAAASLAGRLGLAESDRHCALGRLAQQAAPSWDGLSDAARAVVRGLPVLRVQCSLRPPGQTPGAGACVTVALTRQGEGPPPGRQQQLQRGGGGRPAGDAAYAPYYSKRVEYGWWLVVATAPESPSAAEEGELLGMRHIPPIGGGGGGRTVTYDVPLPTALGISAGALLRPERLRVFLLSDVMQGLNQEVPVG